MEIKFSPPDITEAEIAEVADTLRSGWITTGPKTKRLEEELAGYCHTRRAACLNSATACMEMTLRIMGVGPGDEVYSIHVYGKLQRYLPCRGNAGSGRYSSRLLRYGSGTGKAGGDGEDEGDYSRRSGRDSLSVL